MSIRQPTILLLCFFLCACAQPEHRISQFDSETVAYGMAYRYTGNPVFRYRESKPRQAAADSVLILQTEARDLVFELNRGEHYVQGWETDGTYYDVLCHIPRFVLVFHDTLNRQSNFFSFCDECRNARITNYADYPKSDEFTLSETGMVGIFALRDALFPSASQNYPD